MPRHPVWPLLLAPFLLTGCDQLSERAGFENPAKLEAEGKAIGAACRHAGRGLEDCYRLNRTAQKAAVFAGWREMNDYMVKNNIEVIEPSVPADTPRRARKTEETTEATAAAPAETPGKP